MTMYKILFNGYALVEADSADEAEELFFDDEFVFFETVIDNIVEY